MEMNKAKKKKTHSVNHVSVNHHVGELKAMMLFLNQVRCIHHDNIDVDRVLDG